MSARIVLYLLLIAVGAVDGVRAEEARPTQIAVSAAIGKSLPLLQQAAQGYMAERKCFACHHQTLPLLALTAAASRGLDVDASHVEPMLAFIEKSLESGRARYLAGRGQNGHAILAGYALWTLSLGERKPDATTDMVADFLIDYQKADRGWRVMTNRPPSEASHFAATFVALRGLQTYTTEARREAMTKRLVEVRAWLEETPAEDNEDRVFRLWSLAMVEAPRASLGGAFADLVDRQRPDGGWSQLDGGESDAYATGTALVALREAGRMRPDDRVYRRGVAYLLKSQLADGSWHVKSRSKPIQTYFETGFPHGPDQFISAAATGWATTALALALPICVARD